MTELVDPATIPEAMAYAMANPKEIENLLATRKLYDYYPETGPLRREAYPKHMEFFGNGVLYRERLFLAANRVGKTEGAGGYEMTLHLTGLYPDWWHGRRFEHDISAVAAGDTGKNTRDTVQRKLLGPPGQFGTGLIPKDRLVKTSAKSGIPDAIDSIQVMNNNGKVSRLLLRSYDQGREAFQGDEQHVVWNDEEPPIEVYTEALMRTMTTDGIVMTTFTPLNGYSEVIRLFLEKEVEELKEEEELLFNANA